MIRIPKQFIAVTFILTIVYTVALTNYTYRLTSKLRVNFSVFAVLVFLLSLAIVGTTVRLLHTSSYKNFWYIVLAALVLVISYLLLPWWVPIPRGGIFNLFWLFIGTILLVIMLNPKLNRHNRYHLLWIPFVLILAKMLFLNMIPEISCAISGGSWFGDEYRIGVNHCIYVYPDAYQFCESSDECMGGCLVMDWYPEESRMSGRCEPSTFPYGCFTYIENPESTMCID